MTAEEQDASYEEGPRAPDPRETLAAWANDQDEWLRFIVRNVLSSGRPLAEGVLEQAYALFRQEKGLDPRSLLAEPPLAVETRDEDAEFPLVITKLSDVTGVNALVSGSVIEPHAGLTILFGENGTGKTGYARIFKALAGSRTADQVILGDITAGEEQPQSAHISYALGNDNKEFIWTGEHAVVPFTRLSIFDSPSVNYHVDEDLEYVYVPTVLSLFNHVISGVKAVQGHIESAISDLGTASSTLLSRFPRNSTVYPLIETLGASTDLTELRARADDDSQVDERIDVLRRAVAALEANTIGTEISTGQRHERVLKQAQAAAETLATLDVAEYNAALNRRAELREDYKAFRAELFAAANLPAEPEEAWEAFVSSGDRYRQHLEELGVHDESRCLYCRQALSDTAGQLIEKYRDYLADKISKDLADVGTKIASLAMPVRQLDITEMTAFLTEFEEREDRPTFYGHLQSLDGLIERAVQAANNESRFSEEDSTAAQVLLQELVSSLQTVVQKVEELKQQAANRAGALAEKRHELTELIASAELAKSWSAIQSQVERAKEADKLRILARPLPGTCRAVTELAKSASDQLINQNFDKLFAEECNALRAPTLNVEFVGRQGKAQRRKTMVGKHKPSKVLSEGEQKVLAMADFLAEARLAGITAPVIFDDPVSSLDHRRINEVAERVALLAENHQVIVFTHDIFFATTLLALFENSKRCSYFQVTDEGGKGQVTRASGPRWDTLSNLKANINKTIEAAKAVDGEARAALVREGYDWIRSWCEVFTETELLQGVAQRYQPQVRMTVLPKIKATALPAAVEVVTRVFEEACRYIPGHSQPLPTLGVAPTLSGLEAHWKELQDCRKAYLDAEP
ncbi:hypothetical protein AU184_03740 [Mycolicibacterium novocastrense]|uniref:AAA family ATPase n=1 Tax=Mycolicibacterium novocastrense TaxID=59813 RepID=UPI0007462FC8|nr:AAA family ATPase [Mycolicibacterium novocastrense]KUH70724.1 hypothetical protein AU183_18070 [Mycolicibacterium novocastrense]KUH71736.1 hypothetical protein AU072_11105 [Mycolicibacterium novocastrense]KUH72043.1 hypothetical protein AU184_03740 [Mycolicibacterium novocastrense]